MASLPRTCIMEFDLTKFNFYPRIYSIKCSVPITGKVKPFPAAFPRMLLGTF